MYDREVRLSPRYVQEHLGSQSAILIRDMSQTRVLVKPQECACTLKDIFGLFLEA